MTMVLTHKLAHYEFVAILCIISKCSLAQEKIVAFTMYCLLYDEQCEYIHYCKFYKTNTSNGNCNVNFTLLPFTIVE